MDPLLIFSVVAAALGIPTFVVLRRSSKAGSDLQRRQRVELRNLAEKMGLTYHPGEWPHLDRMFGHIEGVEVEITVSRQAHLQLETQSRGNYVREPIQIVVRGPLPQDLVVKKRPLLQRVLDFDTEFDREVVVNADPLFTAAFLSREVRTALLNLVTRRNCSIVDGKIRMNIGRVWTPGAWGRDISAALEEALELLSMAKLDQRLLPSRLYANFAGPDLAAVRLRCFRALVFEFPDSDISRHAVRDALVDSEAEIALAGAKRSGRAGVSIVRNLVDSPRTPPRVRAEALDFLTREHPARLPVREWLLELIDGSPRLETSFARALVRALSRKGGEGIIEELARLLWHDRETIAIEAARELGRSGSEAARRMIALALAKPLPRPVRVHAQRALYRLRRGNISIEPATGRVSLARGESRGWLSETKVSGALSKRSQSMRRARRPSLPSRAESNS